MQFLLANLLKESENIEKNLGDLLGRGKDVLVVPFLLGVEIKETLLANVFLIDSMSFDKGAED